MKSHCANSMINNQIKGLSKNIIVLEKIKKDYDNFVNGKMLNGIANMFNIGKYKLIQGECAFAYENLK